MTDNNPGATLTPHERTAAEALLADAWGAPVVLDAVEILEERTHALRVVATDGRAAILKRPKEPFDGQSDLEKLGFAIEWATLEYLDAMPEAIAPRLLGAASDPEILLIEELPAGRSLADSLLEGDAATAAADLVTYAEALATMSVWSLGRVGAYEAARRRHGVGDDTRAWRASAIETSRDRFSAVVAALGVNPRGAEPELDEVARIIQDGDHAGVIHGDPCPDNVRITDGQCRIFDFEKTGRGSIALDATYVLAPFPTCWCFAHLPTEVAAPALAAYRRVLDAAGADTGPNWDRALVAALGASLICRSDQLDRVTTEDRQWGTTTMRPRFLQWIDAFVTTATELEVFPRLRVLHTELGERLRAAWPEAVVPEYPAFAGPGAVVARL